MSITPGSKPAHCLELPAHWTPEQALAVFEVLDLLRDQLWAAYGPQIQRAMRDDLMPTEPAQLFDPDEPF